MKKIKTLITVLPASILTPIFLSTDIQIPQEIDGEFEISFYYYSNKDKRIKKYVEEIKLKNSAPTNIKQITLEEGDYLTSNINISYYHRYPNMKMYINNKEIDVGKIPNLSIGYVHKSIISLKDANLQTLIKLEIYKNGKNIKSTEFELFERNQNNNLYPNDLKFKWYAWDPKNNPDQKKYIEPYLLDTAGKQILDKEGNPIKNPNYDPNIDPATGVYSFWDCNETDEIYEDIKSIFSKYSLFLEELIYEFKKQNQKIQLPIFYKVHILPKLAKIEIPNNQILEKQGFRNWKVVNPNDLYFTGGIYRSSYKNSFANYYKFLTPDIRKYSDFIAFAKKQREELQKQSKFYLQELFFQYMKNKYSLSKEDVLNNSFEKLNEFYLEYLSLKEKIRPVWNEELIKDDFLNTLKKYSNQSENQQKIELERIFNFVDLEKTNYVFLPKDILEIFDNWYTILRIKSNYIN